MRLILCLCAFFSWSWYHVQCAEAAKEITRNGVLYAKAEQAPAEALGVLVLLSKNGNTVGSNYVPLVLIADGEVGAALAKLIDQQAAISVTGRYEGKLFRVMSFKLYKAEKKSAGTQQTEANSEEKTTDKKRSTAEVNPEKFEPKDARQKP